VIVPPGARGNGGRSSTVLGHQRALRAHPLFALLQGAQTVEPLASLARGCAWWPMVFQDVLRLNLERVSGTGKAAETPIGGN